jgi:nucleoside-triphosphatase THEP1
MWLIGVLGDMIAVFIVDEVGPFEMLITTYKTT